jgi:hypothetical protein
MIMPISEPILVPDRSPEEVRKQVLDGFMREPVFDPTLAKKVSVRSKGDPKHRLVVIGDSLSHGFQSGAIFNTDISYPAMIANELGWGSRFRYPRYGGLGGLPLNVEYLCRDLEERVGPTVNPWEVPLALFRARQYLDEIEDYWERGPGSTVPEFTDYMHVLAVYGWDLADALRKTANSCRDVLGKPKSNFIAQVVENHAERAAARVYPQIGAARDLTFFDAARAMGDDHDTGSDHGIETLVIFLGANNALQTVTKLKVQWSGQEFEDLTAKVNYTVWDPAHFRAELNQVVDQVRAIKARHVIWCTVPHVTIAPLARGIGAKVRPGSRYFPYYTRPWIADSDFDPHQDRHITDAEARAVDCAIDLYNKALEDHVLAAREAKLDWFLLDVAGMLDRLASRRFIADVNARPKWWTPYPLPGPLAALSPAVDSRFTASDGQGGRAQGGIFSLDGVHPTTVGYGLIAQEMIDVMRAAGVVFRHRDGSERPDPVAIDFNRLIERDSLLLHPPQNVTPTLELIGWADERLDLIKRALQSIKTV